MGYLLNDKQLEVLVNIVMGYDTFAILPTGTARVCASLPFVHGVEGAIAIVITPLVAIIKDQVKHLQSQGLRATGVCKLDETDEETVSGICHGKFQFVYFIPEALLISEVDALYRLVPWEAIR